MLQNRYVHLTLVRTGTVVALEDESESIGLN